MMAWSGSVAVLRRQGEPEIAYDVTGAGPPLLLLHGRAASRQIWAHAGYVAALQSRYRLLSMDFRGHGGSGRPEQPDAYSVVNDVHDVEAVLAASSELPTVICGWSWGGVIALALAALSPRIVKAFVAVGTSVGGAGFSDCPRAKWLDQLPIEADRYEQEGTQWLANLVVANGGDEWLADIVGGNSASAMAAWCRGIARPSALGRRLGDVVQPVSYVMGELEVQLKELQDLSDQPFPPSSSLTVIPAATHVTAFMAKDRVISSIDALIAQNRTVSAT